MASAGIALYSFVAVALFAAFGLLELPARWNARRLQRRLNRLSRRRGTSPARTVARIRRETRLGAWVLLGFALASGALVAWLVVRDIRAGAVAAAVNLAWFGGGLSVGLLLLSLAHLFWAPRLLDLAVKLTAESAATPNSHPPDDGSSHGDRAGLP